MRMHKGARRIAMGRNLEDASEGQTTLSATRAFKKLYHARSMPSLARQQFPSSATATRATRALTQPHTHTHTPHKTTWKRNISQMAATVGSTEREDAV